MKKSFYVHSCGEYAYTLLEQEVSNDAQYAEAITLRFTGDTTPSEEILIVWTLYSCKLSPCVVAYNDGWKSLFSDRKLHNLFRELHNEDIQPYQFVQRLISLGFEDISDHPERYLRPKAFAELRWEQDHLRALVAEYLGIHPRIVNNKVIADVEDAIRGPFQKVVLAVARKILTSLIEKALCDNMVDGKEGEQNS